MVFKVNYNHQRAERTRLKQAKKDAKVREREEAASRRKTDPDGLSTADPSTDMTESGSEAATAENAGDASSKPAAAAGE